MNRNTLLDNKALYHNNHKNDEKNNVAKTLKIFSIIIFILSIIVGFSVADIFDKIYYILPYGIIGGVFALLFYGIGEIISLLQKLVDKSN